MGAAVERSNPDAVRGSSNRYQNWETADPEKWVPDGYACVRVDSRGAGRSPGRLDIFSAQETRDYYECIEWAGAREWSNGKVGLLGISYYAVNQWKVAALRPPHLAAICPWEGASDCSPQHPSHLLLPVVPRDREVPVDPPRPIPPVIRSSGQGPPGGLKSGGFPCPCRWAGIP